MYYKACAGKYPYPSIKLATAASKTLIKKTNSSPMHAYKCQFCSYYHFGHTPGKQPWRPRPYNRAKLRRIDVKITAATML